MHIRQNAEVKAAFLQKDHELPVKATQKFNYVHLISGKIQIGDITIEAGDALLFDDVTTVKAL